MTNTEYFHRHAYERRVRILAETLLAEANHRAAAEKKKAYVHVVGLGLGVWRLLSAQDKWFVDVFGAVLAHVSYPSVSDVDFSWIAVPDVAGVKNGEKFPGTDITVSIDT